MSSIAILGTRGVPACHGGFETFAERLSLYLSARSWGVVVYCQSRSTGDLRSDEWRGVRRVIVPERGHGALGTIKFDWHCIQHVARHRPDVVLTLGYNTALFDLSLHRRGLVNLINMDGVEWRRQKWSWPARLWLLLNERAACRVGDHLIADHPRIAARLASIVPESKITMIPYGADAAYIRATDDEPVLQGLGLESGGYVLVIARPEPENSILEIVSAFSCSVRNCKLVVLGRFSAAKNKYHAAILAAASREVIFPGALYDHAVVSCLRANARLYVHGHQVGGTNPSLVEAMGAGCAILARDNEFNRWVAGSGAVYFNDVDACDRTLSALIDDKPRLAAMRLWSRQRHEQCFTWPMVLRQYEELLTHWAADE